MSLTPEQIQEAQKKAMDKIYADIAECDTVQKLGQLLIHYYQSGYNDGQKVIVEMYKKVISQHSEKLNAPTDSDRPKDK